MKHIRASMVFVILCIAGESFLFSQQVFEVDLNDRSGDTFKVTLTPERLSAPNNIFQFASTAPGTYQTMDIGRFVRDFKALDRSGNEVPTEHSSTNQWTISRPSDVRSITYAVVDIWDSNVDEHRMFPMCSSTISDDFVMLNGQCVFGYFSGMQAEPIKIRLRFPSDWKVGTALTRDGDGYYLADDFDQVVDSPFFLGNLSTATTTVGGATIGVYTYSKTGLITSDTMLGYLKSTLNAEAKFTRGLPVDRYAFLFYFGAFSAGAWEHSYSSEYVFKEDTLRPSYAADVVSVVAHEFFHVNIPLNIHSELVEHFNFVKPVMSQHLWFYEGTTEWAAHILQLRDSLNTLTEYLRVMQGMTNGNDNYDPEISLTTLGVRSTELQDQYPNIYQKGALVSTLLDIDLLRLSHGKTGLRELIMQLSKEYGKKRAFKEDEFFDQVVAKTYPEVGDFINRYIKGTEKLPLKEYFGWLGITYREVGDVDSSRSGLGVGITAVDTNVVVTMVYSDSKSGLMRGDTFVKIDGIPVKLGNARKLFGELTTRKPGSTTIMTIRRKDKEIDLTAVLQPRVMRHVYAANENPWAEQRALREVWMKNM
ncbi:MAG: peptidase [Bacteroidota bacterium]